MNHSKEDVIPAADGLWRDIILALTNVDPKFFNGRGQSCPLCGGNDRARYIHKHDMQFHCNQCGQRNGLMFYMDYTGLSFSDAVNDVGDYLNLIPTDKREAARSNYQTVRSFPDWYKYDMEHYEKLKEAATVNLSPWQRISGLNMLYILEHEGCALIPLLNEQGNACDFVLIDRDGSTQTTGGSKIIPSGFHSVFGESKGKYTYLAVSPYVAAHASIFMQRQVVCVYELENIWEVGKNVGKDWHKEKVKLSDMNAVADEIYKHDEYIPPVVIVSNITETQESDQLKFKQLIFNLKNNTVQRKLYEPYEIMEKRK